jgi:ABC-type transport system involved in multi-copper enzyme maturation permease subunit
MTEGTFGATPTATALQTGERPARTDIRKPTFADVTRSEWHKFWTVRSTYWSLLAVVGLGVGLSALISLAASNHYKDLKPSDRLSWDPTAISTSGFALAQLALGVLGVLIMTSEYSTGSIQTTLASVPRRHPVLLAKACVIAVVGLVVGELGSFAAFLIGQAIIKGNAPSVGLGDRQVLRALIGVGLYGLALGVFALSIGAIVRNTAGSIAILVALLYVLPGISNALPSSINRPILKFWPTQAGGQITNVHRSAHTLSPWAGWGWMCLCTAVLLAVGVALLRTRDV